MTKQSNENSQAKSSDQHDSHKKHVNFEKYYQDANESIARELYKLKMIKWKIKLIKIEK